MTSKFSMVMESLELNHGKELLHEKVIQMGDKKVDLSIGFTVLWTILLGPLGLVLYLMYTYYNKEVGSGKDKQQVKERMKKKLSGMIAQVDGKKSIPANKKAEVKSKLKQAISKVDSYR